MTSNQSLAVVVSLLATLLALAPVSPMDSAQALTPSNITYNDEVCNLTAAGYVGQGSAQDPYQISDSDSLWEVSDCDITQSARAYFELTHPIDAAEATVAQTSSPIGYLDTATAFSFSGVLEGNGYAISGISISSAVSGVGLFAKLENAEIRNLSLNGQVVITSDPGNAAKNGAGALSILSLGSTVLDSITNSVTVRGFYYVGGLIGIATTGQVTISNSVNLAEVTGQYSYVGGLIGRGSSGTSIDVRDSLNSGAIQGLDYVGGLVGLGSAVQVHSSQNSTTVSAHNNVGGIVGYSEGRVGYSIGPAKIIATINSGAISGSNYVGGLVGNGEDLLISLSHNSAQISGTSAVGGLVGEANEVEVLSSHNLAHIGVENQLAGGLVGYADSVNIYLSYNTGTVSKPVESSGALPDSLGGLAGRVDSLMSITQSFNSGSVVGKNRVGGILGEGRAWVSMSMTSVFNTGIVDGNDLVGGFFGYIRQTSITSAFNAGQVTGVTRHDGIVGVVPDGISVSSVYTLASSNFASTSSEADLKTASTFEGFDFEDTWGFGSCSDNGGFPMLRSFAQISSYNSIACGYVPEPEPASLPALVTPAQAAPLPPLPQIDASFIRAESGTRLLIEGRKFLLIKSATIQFRAATISELAEDSFYVEIPDLDAGIYSLDLETVNGRIKFQGLIEIIEPAPVVEDLIISSINPKSSWLDTSALAKTKDAIVGQTQVICLAYSDRPGIVARKKALSRAMHACRSAEQMGLKTRAYAFSGAKHLSGSVKLRFN